ncbi:MAG: hypothetical protein UT05_C0005G0025 [Parcubacteria group bacterium GW2011_GWF2_38_76]|nr:MAG: hypothetical protein UT05_C0005G0025 [Parcubacteria group bacterium GW2011_GWF2_38_76]HBM45595.1 hypothetical protein [Patescibacteria group bacterium]
MIKKGWYLIWLENPCNEDGTPGWSNTVLRERKLKARNEKRARSEAKEIWRIIEGGCEQARKPRVAYMFELK